MIEEISFFLQDKPNKLAKALETLSPINILAFSIDRSAGAFSIVRLLVRETETEQAKKLLSQNAYGYESHMIFALLLPHQPGALSNITNLLGKINVNIDYGYLTVFKGTKKAIVILSTNDIEKTKDILVKNGIQDLDKLPES